MKTDYKNLNSFDLSVVLLIISGMLLIGMFFFNALTAQRQGNVLSALEIFDMHDELSQSYETSQFVFDVPNEFFKQFNLAFVQTVEDSQAFAFEFVAYSDSVTSNYVANEGMVSGVSLDLSFLLPDSPKDQITSNPDPPPNFDMPYSYHANDWALVDQKLIKVWGSYK